MEEEEEKIHHEVRRKDFKVEIHIEHILETRKRFEIQEQNARRKNEHEKMYKKNVYKTEKPY